MENGKLRDAGGWQRFDKSAFGLVYGAITVLSILLAAGGHAADAGGTAIVLFGSVLAITLAKAFAELLSHALEAGHRQPHGAWRVAWRHSSPTLAVANFPTLLFLAATVGWITLEWAALLSQFVCIALLMLVGARVGWVLDRKPVSAVLGCLFSGGIGLGLAVMKFAIH